MTALEAIEKIRVMLGLESEETKEVKNQTETTEVVEAEKVELASATLVDGTIVKTEGDFEVGKQLLVETAEGDIQAPEGRHETTDGLLISVDAEGIITSIDAVEETEQKEELSEDFVSQIVKGLEPHFNKIAELENKINSLNSEFSEFRDEPGSPKIYNNLNDLNRKSESIMESRMAKLVELRRNKSNNK